MKTNITVTIDAELAHEAKVLAAKRGTSLSRLVGEKLEELVRHHNAYYTVNPTLSQIAPPDMFKPPYYASFL